MIKNTVWLYNFPNGRFANAAFQFLFAKYLEETSQFNVIIGDTKIESSHLYWHLFDLPDHKTLLADLADRRVAHVLSLSHDRRHGPGADLKKINEYFLTNPYTSLAIEGYFQYDSARMKDDKHYFGAFTNFLSPKLERTPFQRQIRQIYKTLENLFSERYVISIHVRRGDYLNFSNPLNPGFNLFWPLDLTKVLEYIKLFLHLNKIENSLIYVATDDIDFSRKFFLENSLQIISSSDLFPDCSSTRSLLVDLCMLSSSNIVVASNSSFSLLGCLLNEKARLFLRQSGRNGDIVAFDPWNTPILYGL
jgi:hypothetical protein